MFNKEFFLLSSFYFFFIHLFRQQATLINDSKAKLLNPENTFE